MLSCTYDATNQDVATGTYTMFPRTDVAGRRAVRDIATENIRRKLQSAEPGAPGSQGYIAVVSVQPGGGVYAVNIISKVNAGFVEQSGAVSALSQSVSAAYPVVAGLKAMYGASNVFILTTPPGIYGSPSPSASPAPPSKSGSSSNTANLIAGGIAGGIAAGVVLLVCCIWMLCGCRCCRKGDSSDEDTKDSKQVATASAKPAPPVSARATHTGDVNVSV